MGVLVFICLHNCSTLHISIASETRLSVSPQHSTIYIFFYVFINFFVQPPPSSHSFLLSFHLSLLLPPLSSPFPSLSSSSLYLLRPPFPPPPSPSSSSISRDHDIYLLYKLLSVKIFGFFAERKIC